MTLRQTEHADPHWNKVGKNSPFCRKKRALAVIADPD
jgi:hypothetical protein